MAATAGHRGAAASPVGIGLSVDCCDTTENHAVWALVSLTSEECVFMCFGSLSYPSSREAPP